MKKLDFSCNFHFNMQIAVSFVLYFLQVSLSQELDCPPPFRDIFGVCLHFPNKTMNWCDAQTYCSSIGGELIRGKSFLPFNGTIFSGMPESYWIGLTDFRLERGMNRSGWVWTDGSLEPISADLFWGRVQPSKPNRDCAGICWHSRKICAFSCNYSITPMCQVKSNSSLDDRGTSYEQDTIPLGLSGDQFAQIEGCSRLLTQVISEIECAGICSIGTNVQCVSFYYNQETRQCRLVFHTDATIDVKDPESWKKFVAKK